MAASFFGVLKNHNHTSNVGDGGTLTGLSVSSGLTVASGDLAVTSGKASEGGTPAAATDIPTIALMSVWSFALGS